MKKRLLAVMMCAAWGMCATSSYAQDAAQPIQVQIDNTPVQFQKSPVIKRGTLLVPMRGFLEAMGGDVSYQPKSRNVKINIAGAAVEMKVGARYIYVNGKERTLTEPVPVVDGHLMIPLRSVAEKLGATVTWNNAQRIAYIKDMNLDSRSSEGIRAGEIEVRAKANKSTFRTGETVHFTVTATNTDDQPRSLTLPSGQTFDITITPTGKDSPQWKWSHGKAFTMAIRYVKLQPGQQLTFTTEWNQTDNDGKLMPRGEVDVNAVLVSMNAGIKAELLQLQLVD